VQIGVDQAVADKRIAQLEALLHDATIVDDDGDDRGIVAVGRSVVVQYTRTGERRTFRIGGIAGAERERFVSARSPVGQALLGHAQGDLVSVTLPTGAEEELLIVSVTA
ncbi:MAG TPA: GreA/GreB family elongation factor, partial [Solirubrobacteraceae bacterium]|nr:GreA/GreB family elongation factor [Solirubrobacteraceae bacterium]